MNKKILFLVSALCILENTMHCAAPQKRPSGNSISSKTRPGKKDVPGAVNLSNISPIISKQPEPFNVAANAALITLNSYAQKAAISAESPSSPQQVNSPANRAIIDGQTDTALTLTLAALNGATYTFTGFSGALTGGSFSNNNGTGTFSNALATQDVANTVTGTLVIPAGNFAGSFTDIELTGSFIINATVTGTTVGDYFTGTDFTAGNISTGNFDIILVTLPAGTVFNIVDGDLGPTGTFTTTATTYAYLTGGLSSPLNITNGNVTQVGTVAGTFKYLGVDFAGGTLSNLSFTGVYAAGTSPDANHFNAASATGTVEDGTSISITKSLATTNNNNTLLITAGTYNNELVTGFSGINSNNLGAGTFNTAFTGLDGTTITIPGPTCIQGDVLGSTPVHLEITVLPVIVTDANLSGTMQAGSNNLIFTGTQIVTGTIAQDFVAGNCP